MSTALSTEIKRRRTFAIISHPDAGKTTLTEKLLLFAGAIQIAGSVKARKARRHATSDWMEIEKERGISVLDREPKDSPRTAAPEVVSAAPDVRAIGCRGAIPA